MNCWMIELASIMYSQISLLRSERLSIILRSYVKGFVGLKLTATKLIFMPYKGYSYFPGATMIGFDV